MKVFATSFWLQKAGNIQDEYEDALCPKNEMEWEGKLLRFAVADGASEGILSGKWAEILVRTYCKFKVAHLLFNDFLERAYRCWNIWKRFYLQAREKRNRPIQWYEEPGLQSGAFAAFIGLTILQSQKGLSGKWEAIALGDSCLFQVRGETLSNVFPVEHSPDFNNRPWLISSNHLRNEYIFDEIKKAEGDWCIDDQFYLMTDALACWFLREYEVGHTPWKIIRDLGTYDQQKSFEDWISELRTRKQIRNDDVTLIRIDITDGDIDDVLANRPRLSRSHSKSSILFR